jgi:hypothetical protein
MAINSSDPPKSAGGEGAGGVGMDPYGNPTTGNDWNDFGIITGLTMRCRKIDPLTGLPANYDPANIIIKIMGATKAAVPPNSTANPNFANAHAISDSGIKATHYHYYYDYGDSGSGCTVAEGDDYWDWFYSGYTPLITRSGHATTSGFCTKICYNGYKGTAVIASVVNVGDAWMFRDELFNLTDEVAWNGNIYADDRWDDATNHCWKVTSNSDATGHNAATATSIHWKANTSGEYDWGDPECPSNYGPSSDRNFYDVYNGVFKAYSKTDHI